MTTGARLVVSQLPLLPNQSLAFSGRRLMDYFEPLSLMRAQPAAVHRQCLVHQRPRLFRHRLPLQCGHAHFQSGALRTVEA